MDFYGGVWDPIYMGGRGFPYVDPYLHGGKGTGAFFGFFSIALSCFLSLVALLGCLGAFLGLLLGTLGVFWEGFEGSWTPLGCFGNSFFHSCIWSGLQKCSWEQLDWILVRF